MGSRNSSSSNLVALSESSGNGGIQSPSLPTVPPIVDTKPTLEGLLTIQFVGKKKARNVYQCVLKGGILYYKKKVGLGGGTKASSSTSTSSSSSSSLVGSSPNGKDTFTGEIKQIIMSGAQIRRLEEIEMKGMKFAIEVIHPERKIIYKIDYLYLITETELDLERWYFALLTCCVPHNGYVDVEVNKLLHDRFKYMWRSQETANWLSALWARFHLNVRVSTSLREKMINKVALRLSEKIEEKGYEQYIGNLQITDLDFGSKPPTIESAMIQPPDSTGDLIADVWLHYRNGDASLTLSCEVNFKRIMIIPIAVTVSCKSFSGKLQLRVPPFPAERLSISFYEEPTMDLVIEMAIGEKAGQVKNMILPKIKDIILSRLKLAIVERFVAPHRKYFRIPGTSKKDPQSDKPASFAVKTSLKNVHLANGASTTTNGPPASVPQSSSSTNLSSVSSTNIQSAAPLSTPLSTTLNSSTSISPSKARKPALQRSSSSVTSDDDFSNWSPALSRTASATSISGSEHSAATSNSSTSRTISPPNAHNMVYGASHPPPTSRADLIRLSLESSSSSSSSSAVPHEKLETATYEERVMAPNHQSAFPSISSTGSQRSSLTGESLAAELEGIGLAPVGPPTSSSSRTQSPSRRGNNGSPGPDESRLSTKVKGIFRSYFPKTEPGATATTPQNGKDVPK
jgi:hypothetical protein